MRVSFKGLKGRGREGRGRESDEAEAIVRPKAFELN